MIGTILLLLPISTYNSKISFIDALFTSTSAFCVTGLTVLDTGSYFSPLGKIFIILLIQLGGIGIMSLSTFIILILKNQLSISDKLIINETISKYGTINVKTIVKYIFIFTFSFELLGALLLFLKWKLYFQNSLKCLLYAIFHSISAFCNAGFSIFSDNLIRFQNDFITVFVITFLIIFGGLGFGVIYELKELIKSKIKRKKFIISLHSKIVIITTIFLILFGILILNITENSNILKGKTLFGRFLITYFQSVTPRTAGFSTINIGNLTYASLLFIIFLMFVGGSPGSTAGGIKTTTFATLMLFVKSLLKSRNNIEAFQKTIPNSIFKKSIAIFILSLTLLFILSFLLLYIEKDKFIPIKVIFEAVSAFGTVGLSTGITPFLKDYSKLILIILMIVGKTGPLTIAMSVIEKQDELIKYPNEEISVG
jgi:trk system potassium uptake protein TrkH